MLYKYLVNKITGEIGDRGYVETLEHDETKYELKEGFPPEDAVFEVRPVSLAIQLREQFLTFDPFAQAFFADKMATIKSLIDIGAIQAAKIYLSEIDVSTQPKGMQEAKAQMLTAFPSDMSVTPGA